MNPAYFKVPRQVEESVRVEYWDLDEFYKPFHFHDECQLTLIVSSKGILFAGNNLEEFCGGDLFFLGKRLPHVFQRDDADPYWKESNVKAISVFFDKDTIMESCKGLPEAHGLIKLLEDSQYGLKLRSSEELKIEPFMRRMLEISGFSRIIQLLHILNLLSQRHDIHKISTQKPDAIDPLDSKRLNTVYEYILHNYRDKITLDEVSSLVNMTPHAFCRFFKKRTNKTFSNLLIEVRISKACKMLTQEDSSVAETCYSTGYNNMSNFHRQFRKVTGLTPNEYKRTVLYNSYASENATA